MSQTGPSNKRVMEITLSEQQLLYRLRQLAKSAGMATVVVWLQGGNIAHVAKLEDMAKMQPDLDRASHIG